ncbi:MAG: HigA family addiction module antitoxin [Roseiarcus sp.]|jgi:addiction module HigA family antidote
MTKTHEIFDAPPDGFVMAPVHPGEVLQEDIAARGLTAHALALKLRVPANRLTEIIAGKRGISPDTALRLSRYLGPGAAFWLNLQSPYDPAMAEKRLGAKIRAEVEAA